MNLFSRSHDRETEEGIFYSLAHPPNAYNRQEFRTGPSCVARIQARHSLSTGSQTYEQEAQRSHDLNQALPHGVQVPQAVAQPSAYSHAQFSLVHRTEASRSVLMAVPSEVRPLTWALFPAPWAQQSLSWLRLSTNMLFGTRSAKAKWNTVCTRLPRI